MINVTVNGRRFDLVSEPDETLAEVLREELYLQGVRVSCAEGECGSCTVLVDGEPVTACLMLIGQANGRAVETIEGLASGDRLHPIQEAFIAEQGFQCGACTPGFIMSAKAFLARNPNPSAEEVAVAMSGNICRCGAHPYIVRSVLAAARAMETDS